MKNKKIGLNYKNKVINLNTKKLNEFEKVIGLMFSRRENAKILLFEFKKPTKIKLHSWFVFFPFLAVWTDEKNNIIDKKIIKPFQAFISPKKPFSKLIEIPINNFYSSKVKSLVEQKI